MAEEKELTGIERELVLQYLRDDNVPVTVSLESKPQQIDSDLVEGKNQGPSADSRVSYGAIFPVAIKSQQMKVLDQGIILLQSGDRTIDNVVQQFLGKQVKVQFYFNRLGLYFITEMKNYSGGLAIVVPKSIKRIPDVQISHNFDFTAKLSYFNDDSKIDINCSIVPSFPLFIEPKWGHIALENQLEAKNILMDAVNQSKAGIGAPIGNGVHLFPVCNFLTCQNVEENSAVEGRKVPLTVIYIDHSKIVFAAHKNSSDFLMKDSEYDLQLEFTFKENSLLKRKISIKCIVTNEYAKNLKKCYVAEYSTIKTEDERFLYERYEGKVLDS